VDFAPTTDQPYALGSGNRCFILPIRPSLRYAFSELLLIVAGILIALAVLDWHEQNLQRQSELSMLREIRSALVADLDSLAINLQFWNESAAQLEALTEVLKTAPPYDPSMDQLFGAAYGTRPIFLNTAAYESLKSAGLQTVSNRELRLGIARIFDEHYESVSSVVDIDFRVVTEVMRPYFLAHFRNLVFLKSATPLDYQAVVTDTYFENIVSYRLTVVTGNQVKAYTCAIDDMSLVLELLDAERGDLQSLTTKGIAISAAPMPTSGSVPDTKYGYTISASPQSSGTNDSCFLPYMKNAMPAALNTMTRNK